MIPGIWPGRSGTASKSGGPALSGVEQLIAGIRWIDAVEVAVGELVLPALPLLQNRPEEQEDIASVAPSHGESLHLLAVYPASRRISMPLSRWPS
jgi:hypothetical protein